MDYVSSISGLSFIDLDLDPEELGGYIIWIPPGFLGSMGVKLLVPLIGRISPQWAISDSDSDHIYIYTTYIPFIRTYSPCLRFGWVICYLPIPPFVGFPERTIDWI